MARLGHTRDGGYVVPEDQLQDCRTLVSLGLSDDVSFDRDFLRRNPRARVIGVDDRVGPAFVLRRLVASSWKVLWHTMTGNQIKRRSYCDSVRTCLAIPALYRHPNRRLRKRVSSRTGSGDISLTEILTTAGGDGSDVFLKMDIEGAEYEIISEMAEQATRIRCIAAEFHHLDERTSDFNAAIRTLAADFAVVHVHGNNFAPWSSRIEFPCVVEVTLLNRNVLETELPRSTAEYPRTGLDHPCNPALADYRLVFEQASGRGVSSEAELAAQPSPKDCAIVPHDLLGDPHDLGDLCPSGRPGTRRDAAAAWFILCFGDHC